MSDSHDVLPNIGRAVEFFNKSEVSLVLHAGDINSPFAVEPLKGLEADFKGVLGNNDGDMVSLNRVLEDLNTSLTDFLELEYDSRKIAVYHGTIPSILDSIIVSGKYDIVVSGHTHTPEVSLTDNVLVVNPGELCGYLTGHPTVALLDPVEMKAEIHEI